MAILKANFEFTYDKNTNCYFTFLNKNGILIPLQCDNGSSHSSISLLSLIEDGFEYTQDKASQIEEELLIQKNEGKREIVKGNNLVVKLKSASGDDMFGFLTDMGKISIGDADFEHFYYYFVPKNKTAFALMGNDFLHHCEYKHNIGGNIVITGFDEDGYINSHKEALTQNEIKSLIHGITSIFTTEEEEENDDIDPMLQDGDPRWQ